MRWTQRGADRLLQVRRAVYNGTLNTGFGQRFQAANNPHPPAAIAACPPNFATVPSSPLRIVFFRFRVWIVVKGLDTNLIKEGNMQERFHERPGGTPEPDRDAIRVGASDAVAGSPKNRAVAADALSCFGKRVGAHDIPVNCPLAGARPKTAAPPQVKLVLEPTLGRPIQLANPDHS